MGLRLAHTAELQSSLSWAPKEKAPSSRCAWGLWPVGGLMCVGQDSVTALLSDSYHTRNL